MKFSLSAVIPFGVAAFVVSLMVLVIIITFTKRQMWWKPTNKLVLSLLMADSFTAWAIFLLVMVLKGGKEDPLYSMLQTIVSLLISTTSMCSVTIDRFVAIVYPLRYNRLIGKRFVTCSISITWGFPILGGVACLVAINLTETNVTSVSYASSVLLIVSVLFTILLLGVTNLVIFMNIRRQIKNLPRMSSQTAFDNITHRTVIHKDFTWKQEVRAAYLCSMIVLAFLFSWVPKMIFLFAKVLENETLDSTALDLMAFIGLICNAYIDIALYVFLNRDIRKALIITWIPRKLRLREDTRANENKRRESVDTLA